MNMFSQLGMIITRVANGWILELPRKNDAQVALGGMVDAVKGIAKDQLIDPTPGYTHIQHPLMPNIQDMDIYVFLSLRQLSAFIDIHFNQVND